MVNAGFAGLGALNSTFGGSAQQRLNNQRAEMQKRMIDQQFEIQLDALNENFAMQIQDMNQNYISNRISLNNEVRTATSDLNMTTTEMVTDLSGSSGYADASNRIENEYQNQMANISMTQNENFRRAESMRVDEVTNMDAARLQAKMEADQQAREDNTALKQQRDASWLNFGGSLANVGITKGMDSWISNKYSAYESSGRKSFQDQLFSELSKFGTRSLQLRGQGGF